MTSNCNIKWLHFIGLKFYACFTGESPRGGASQARAELSSTKLLYQPKPDPETYIVPIFSILGRLPLVPAGDHGTIPAAMRNNKGEIFKYGECDKDGRRGSGSKLYYINSWAICWPSDHLKRPLTG